jgi:hypothetical protein
MVVHKQVPVGGITEHHDEHAIGLGGIDRDDQHPPGSTIEEVAWNKVLSPRDVVIVHLASWTALHRPIGSRRLFQAHSSRHTSPVEETFSHMPETESELAEVWQETTRPQASALLLIKRVPGFVFTAAAMRGPQHCGMRTASHEEIKSISMSVKPSMLVLPLLIIVLNTVNDAVGRVTVQLMIIMISATTVELS